jgi:tetratricopeptide (TPR) repeat protein
MQPQSGKSELTAVSSSNTEQQTLRWWSTEFLKCKKYGRATALALQCWKNSRKAKSAKGIVEDTILLGLCFSAQGMIAEARVCAKDSTHLLKDIKNSGTFLARHMKALGELYLAVGLEDEALLCLEKYCVSVEALHGEESVVTADAYNFLGCFLVKVGRSQRALKYCKKALVIRSIELGSSNIYTANSHYNVGLISRVIGDLDTARKEFSEVYRIRKLLHGAFSLPTAEVEISLGFTQEQRGYLQDASNRFERAHRIRKWILGEAHEYTIEAHRLLQRVVEKRSSKQPSIEHKRVKMYSLDELDHAINYVNSKTWATNMVNRSHALNPFIQVAMIMSLAGGSLSSNQISAQFGKHYDLIEPVIECVGLVEREDITVPVIIQAIDKYLSTVTQMNSTITPKVRDEILSAAPLSAGELEHFFVGNNVATQGAKCILDCIKAQKGTSCLPALKRHEIDSRISKLVLVVSKMNANALAKGRVPVITAQIMHELLVAAQTSNFEIQDFMKIMSPQLDLGEIIFAQLVTNNLKREHCYSRGNIIVAAIITREIYPLTNFSCELILKCASLEITKPLLYCDVEALVEGHSESNIEMFLSVLSTVGELEYNHSFLGVSKIAPDSPYLRGQLSRQNPSIDGIRTNASKDKNDENRGQLNQIISPGLAYENLAVTAYNTENHHTDELAENVKRDVSSIVEDYVSNSNQTDEIELGLTVQVLQQLKSHYPDLSKTFDEIESILNNAGNAQEFIMTTPNKSIPHVRQIKRNNTGCRVKLVPLSGTELWSACKVKLYITGTMLRSLRARKTRVCFHKLRSLGTILGLGRVGKIKRGALRIFGVSLFPHIFKLSNQRRRPPQKFGAGKVQPRTEKKILHYEGPRLRGVHWSTVKESETKGTVWEGKKRTFSTIKHLFSDVEEIFAPGTSDISTTGNSKMLKKQLNSFLDPKRTQNLGIALARVWTGSYADLAHAITYLKVDLIGLDNVEMLLKIAPTKEETAKVKKYDGDLALLNKADRFVLEVANVKRLNQRLAAMLYCGRFEEQIATTTDGICLIKCASDEIISSQKFPELLGIVLSLGNKLNQNTRQQLAAGIKVDSLTKLATTKGKTGVTVLEYMVENLVKRNPDILELSHEFDHLKSASVVNYGTLVNDMKRLQRGFDSLTEQLSIDEKSGEDIFACEFGSFHEKASLKIETLNETFWNMKEAYARASRWLFEDPKKNEPAILFKSILDFLSALSATKAKVQEKHERALKVAQRNHLKSTRNNANTLVTKNSDIFLKSANQREAIEKRRRFSVDAWADTADEKAK